MSYTRRAAALAVLCLFLSGPEAHGMGWRLFRGSSYSHPVYLYRAPTVTYYTPAPVYVASPVVCQPVAVVTPPRPLVYAVPTPAPPSQTVEPPMKTAPRGAPKITESRSSVVSEVSLNDSLEVGIADRCRVGFWNASDRDLRLSIDGQVHILPRNRSITLTLGRRFTWSIDARPARTETVPDDGSTHEVVIRQ
jgi:hypothetical protein